MKAVAVNTFLALVLGCTVNASADSWALPKVRTFCSSNKKFCLKVTPRQLGSQLAYFEDKVAGKEPAGQQPGSSVSHCTAELYARKRFGRKTALWNIRLSNEVAPVDALVSDDGRYVVTLDNWHGAGYGDNVVAIYGANGTLLRKYSLEELLGDEIKKVTTSVSSRWWRENERLDPKTSTLYVDVPLHEYETVLWQGKLPVRKKGGWERNYTRLLSVRLDTGQFSLAPAP